jgi:hypothetical protein
LEKSTSAVAVALQAAASSSKKQIMAIAQLRK